MSGTKPVGQHQEKRLSAAFVRTVTAAGLYNDGHGLFLKVDPSGAKRWVQRLVINGKRRDIGMGSASLVALSEAREQALQHRKDARAGGNPIANRKRSTGILTFEEASRKVHEVNAPTWRNAKHAQQWLNTLSTFVFPVFGDKRIDAVTSADVLAAITPVWNTRPETARRVKQRIGSVMDWAMANGWRSDNPANTISKALPKHDRSTVQHRKALPYDQVAVAIATVKASEAGAMTKLAFEFLVLTATRSAETREATWAEIDLQKREWMIPGSRMKAKKAHRVPLTDRCIAILEEASRDGQGPTDYVFPGIKSDKPLSDMTLSKLMKELKIPAVPHGFRSSFRDWAGEATHHPREVIEFALAHVLRDKAEAAYARSDLFEKRRHLMNEWDAYLSAEIDGPAES